MIAVKPLGGPFGASVTGLDLSKPLNDADIRAVIELLHENRILRIEEQRQLSKERFSRFAHYWGRPRRPRFAGDPSDDQYPEITPISNSTTTPDSLRDAAAMWHTDKSYELLPDSVSMIYGVETPLEGGETFFADTAAAYEDLPEETKSQIEDLRVRHALGRGKRMAGEEAPFNHNGSFAQDRKDEEFIHPLVLRHPVSGRKALYAVAGSAYAIVGMEDEKADKLLAALKAHALQKKYRTSAKCRTGDVLIWDNLCTLHSASPIEYSDEPGKRRVLMRISTNGLPAIYGTLSPAFPNAVSARSL